MSAGFEYGELIHSNEQRAVVIIPKSGPAQIQASVDGITLARLLRIIADGLEDAPPVDPGVSR